MKTIATKLWRLPRNSAIVLIAVYQHTLSVDHGPLKQLYPYGYCRHSPTCSEYAKLQLQQGFCIGIWKGIMRVLSCTPWHKPSNKKLSELHNKI